MSRAGDRSRESAAAVLALANLLEVSEFSIFESAYRAWFGAPPSPSELDRHFGRYLSCGVVPAWVRHYARSPLAREIDPSDPLAVFHPRIVLAVLLLSAGAALRAGPAGDSATDSAADGVLAA